MDIQLRKNCGSQTDIQMMIHNDREEIDLDDLKLLKLKAGQPGARVMCTAGILWLTLEGDIEDHIIHAGQSFTLDQRGIILVQGLPRGKALILEKGKVSVYNHSQARGGKRWTRFLNRSAP